MVKIARVLKDLMKISCTLKAQSVYNLFLRNISDIFLHKNVKAQ